MKILTKTILVICLATLALPARAAEVPDVVRVLFDSWKTRLPAEPTYESINDDGLGNISISKLKLEQAAASGQSGMTLTIDEIRLQNVSDRGNGLYEIGDASFAGTKMTIVDSAGTLFSITVPGGTAAGWYLKDAGDTPAPMEAYRASTTIARKMSSGPMAIEVRGHTITVDGYDSTWDGDPETGAGRFTAKLANVVIPETALAQFDTAGTLKQLGYSDVAFDITGDGEMEVADNKVGLDLNVAYIGKDMGAVTLSADVSDIPVAALTANLEARSAGRIPDYTALMPELQKVSFSGLSFRFDDDSITKKVLPMIAALQGLDEATMRASAGAMLQLSLMQLGNQSFTDQVVGAVNSFLKDPRSITLTMKPASPIKVEELMMLNPAAPGEAIDKLGVSVTAND